MKRSSKEEHPFMWMASIVCLIACASMVLIVIFGLY